MNAFQELLEGERQRLGLTWPELVRRTGLPYATLRRIILDPSAGPPKEEQLRKLARGLNLSLRFLQEAVVRLYFGWDLFGEETEEDRLLIASVRELTETERRAIRAMVDELRRPSE